MMPDLGKYAVAVLAAYGVSIAFLCGLILASLWRGARVKRQLDEAEQELRDG